MNKNDYLLYCEPCQLSSEAERLLARLGIEGHVPLPDPQRGILDRAGFLLWEIPARSIRQSTLNIPQSSSEDCHDEDWLHVSAREILVVSHPQSEGEDALPFVKVRVVKRTTR